MKKLLFLLLCLSGFSACKDTTITGEINLKGQVIDAASSRPLDSATVQLYEDNEGPFMGKKVIKEFTTDGSGTFKISFKYKEGPYVLKVVRQDYVYRRMLKNVLGGPDVAVDYLSVEEFKKNQDFTFDMEALVPLDLHLKNVAPASGTDKISVSIEGMSKQNPNYAETFAGVGEFRKTAGMVAANKFLTITSTITENGATRTVQDTLFIHPKRPNTYSLEF